MKRLFGKTMIKLMGWNIHPDLPPEIKKCVLVMAPHTSNWDFFIGCMAFWGIYQVDIRMLIKKDLFFPPLGWLLKWMGGIPVDRKNKTNLTQVISKMYAQKDELTIIFTPEGTRSYNPRWKKGFYYIAQEANVPILLGFLDYPSKSGGVFKLFEPTGNVEQDIAAIKALFKQYKGKYPEQGVRQSD